MQTQIRSVSEEDFQSVGNFIALHENKELTSPNQVVIKLEKVMNNPKQFEGVCLSLRDVE
jgi:hypothetical protein